MDITPEEVALLNVRNWFVGVIVLLAAVGLGITLFKNPAGLMRQLLFMAIAITAIYVIYRIWAGKKQGSKENRSFAKAAKQSKRRAKSKKSSVSTASHSRKKPLRKKSTAHLTVIEGKKNKKKDRAIF